MEKNNSSRLEKFFEGKGFYIVLALCVAVIGISVWSIASEKAPDVNLDPGITLDNNEPVQDNDEDEAPVFNDDEKEIVDIIEGEGVETGTWRQGDTFGEPAKWVWPVAGELEREYAMESLAYDVTMADWRTHDGIDVAAEMGDVVRAASAGKIEAVYDDDLYGTTVIIDHGDGLKTVYSNLAATPTVKVGDTVASGDVIGSVGDTAICEIGEGNHVHVAMSKKGESVNPLEYLPE